ncbi:MAG: ssDNA-binding domain-containing protein [Prevotella sp.]|nr:ssDNA-binding domain-containing protein [Prevotella sp.]
MAQEVNRNYQAEATEHALDKFAEMMIEKIESIDRDWTKPWFTESARQWPRNLYGRKYNGSNALMLMMHQEKQGYQLPVYGTFDALQRLNYQGKAEELALPSVTVNKGEKSFPVMLTTFTVVNDDTNEKIKYDEYKKLSREDQARFKVFPKTQVYRVFNVAQTNLETARPMLYAQLKEGLDFKKPFTREGLQLDFPAIDEMIKKDLWHCKINPEKQDCAFYDIRKDEITVPMKEQFRDNESFYGTLFHEMTHSTGAEKRLNRFDENKGWGTSNNFYAREELVAEMGAALIGSKYGLKKHLKDDSASYLKSWLDSLKEDPKYIKTVLDDVRKATYMVGQRVDLIQGQIDSYQAKEGHSKDYPETYDINQDENSLEVKHSEKEKNEKERNEKATREIAAKGFRR